MGMGVCGATGRRGAYRGPEPERAGIVGSSPTTHRKGRGLGSAPFSFTMFWWRGV